MDVQYRTDSAVKFDLEEVVARLGATADHLLKVPVEEIIDCLDRFSKHLLDRNCLLLKKYPGYGVPYIAHWCRRSHLESILALAFDEYSVLDQFQRIRQRGDRLYRAFPKGLVVHWMAGNVPTLGFLSLIQGLLTKNVNLVKVASDSDDFLADLLGELRSVESPAGILTGSVAVVRYAHQETSKGELLSRNADTRIMWGSDEALKEIQSLPTKPNTQDILFPSKISMMAIGGEMLQGDLDSLARRAAIDISTFEQKACASPHTIFIETDSDDELERFALVLKSALQRALQVYPKVAPSASERNAVMNLRAEYDMFHRAWYSKGIEYSILSDDKCQIGPAIGNRTVFLRKVSDLSDLAGLISSKIQTVGLAVAPEKVDQVTTLLGRLGVQRFTRVGTMTNFEVPWDGYLIPQLLVRWTSRATFEQDGAAAEDVKER